MTASFAPYLSLLALVACVQVRPPESNVGLSEGTYPVGTRLRVVSDWSAQCVSWLAKNTPPNQNGSSIGSDTLPCHEKPLRLAVSCTPACGLPDGSSIDGRDVALTFVPLASGPLTVDTVATRLDTGEVSKLRFMLTITDH